MAEMTVEYLDGDAESSNFVARQGQARVTYGNGDVYEGPFDSRRLKHGKDAKYTFAATSADDDTPSCVYEGEYLDGGRTGVGRMTLSDGTVYRGEWLQGFRHGKGSYTYANQDLYSGEWANGKRQGKGTYMHAASQTRLDATWDKGAPVEGSFVHPDGTKYSGRFDDHKFAGEYQLSFPSGIDIQGEFYQRQVGKEAAEECWRPADLNV